MNKRAELGYKTAKGGFKNEKEICKKFNDWKSDKIAQEWLEIMGYDVNKISFVEAIQIPTNFKKIDSEKYYISGKEYDNFIHFKKADAQVKILIQIGNILKIENISLKKANSDADYNQIDKRSVDSYKKIWNFDDEIALWLKLFTGEIIPQTQKKLIGKKQLKDIRRLFINEMPKKIQNKIIGFFNKNKILIIADILKGRGGLSSDWVLVTKFNKQENITTWILKDINTVMNYFGSGMVKISPRGSLRIGKITVQRKGGTPDPTKLQFKFKPCSLFKMDF